MTESNADGVLDLFVILVLSVLLVSGILLWHPWSGTMDAWTTAAPQQPTSTTPDDSLPTPEPNTLLT